MAASLPLCHHGHTLLPPSSKATGPQAKACLSDPTWRRAHFHERPRSQGPGPRACAHVPGGHSGGVVAVPGPVLPAGALLPCCRPLPWHRSPGRKSCHSQRTGGVDGSRGRGQGPWRGPQPGRRWRPSPLSQGPVLGPWPLGALMHGLGLARRTPRGCRGIMWAGPGRAAPRPGAGPGRGGKSSGRGGESLLCRGRRAPPSEDLQGPPRVPRAQGHPGV